MPILVLGLGIIMSPGEAGIAGRTHLGAFGVPGEMVGFGIPHGCGGDGGVAEDGGFAVVEGDGVVGEPGGEGLAAAFGDGIGELAFQLDELKDAGREGGKGERGDLGLVVERTGVGGGRLRVLGREARRGAEASGDKAQGDRDAVQGRV